MSDLTDRLERNILAMKGIIDKARSGNPEDLSALVPLAERVIELSSPTKKYMWWQCKNCHWFDWAPIEAGQPHCANCKTSLMLARPPVFTLTDVQAAKLPHLPIRPAPRKINWDDDGISAAGHGSFE